MCGLSCCLRPVVDGDSLRQRHLLYEAQPARSSFSLGYQATMSRWTSFPETSDHCLDPGLSLSESNRELRTLILGITDPREDIVSREMRGSGKEGSIKLEGFPAACPLPASVPDP